MKFEQKYCLVSFIKPEHDMEFDMTNWPLHITLADVFSIDLKSTNIESKLKEMLSNESVINTFAEKETKLGATNVVLINSSKDLLPLHNNLINILEINGAKFNNPDFTKKGFIPHCTIQNTERINSGDKVKIDRIALVDMFTNQNWKQRKILSTFNLSG